VIPATQEVEMGRIAVQGQARQKVCETLPLPMAGLGGMNLSSQHKYEDQGPGQLSPIKDLYCPISKITNIKRPGRVVKVVACPPSKW
jgi:hypothetical protein